MVIWSKLHAQARPYQSTWHWIVPRWFLKISNEGHHNLSEKSVAVPSHLHSGEVLPQYSGEINFSLQPLALLLGTGKSLASSLHEASLQILTGVGEVSGQISLLEAEHAQLLQL